MDSPRNTLVSTHPASSLCLDHPFPWAALSTTQIDWVMGDAMIMETTTLNSAIGTLAIAVQKPVKVLSGCKHTIVTCTTIAVV